MNFVASLDKKNLLILVVGLPRLTQCPPDVKIGKGNTNAKEAKSQKQNQAKQELPAEKSQDSHKGKESETQEWTICQQTD
jgi:hypothetical protein